MCGITGWVDFDRDLTTEKPTVDAMTETMRFRGPDDEGTWLSPHAAFGHRRLAVIDIEGGRQPMHADDLAVITYSGEVYNFRELRAELEGKGHRFRTRSDTEVVLRAYLEWGENFVDRLNGMYAFALWDIRRQELLLVRDRMGIKPLYYFPLPSGVLFGSEPKAILANPLAEPVLDLDGLREMLTHVKTPGASAFAGMYEVRPGHVVRIRREGMTSRCYWKLEAQEHTDDIDTTVRTVADLLDDIVQRQLISDVPLCSLLSGGLDSSAITVLAHRYDPVRSFSVDFSGYTENFQPDEMRVEPDGPYVDRLVRHVGADHTNISLNTGELADPRLRAAAVRAWDMPSAAGDMNTSLYMLFRAIREHSTVALSGEAADEVFGGYAWFYLPQIVEAETFPWLAVLMQASTSYELFDRELLDKLDMPTFVADSYRTALAEVPHVDGQDAHERRMRELCYFHLTRFVQWLLDRKDRISMAVGLEVRVPFCDHRLVQYAFNTPWSYKTFDGREKSLLRAAARELVPAPILDRAKSPYPAVQDPAYEQHLRDELGRHLTSGQAPIAGLLDQEAVAGVLSSPVEKSTSTASRFRLELPLDLDVWLREYGAELRF